MQQIILRLFVVFTTLFCGISIVSAWLIKCHAFFDKKSVIDSLTNEQLTTSPLKVTYEIIEQKYCVDNSPVFVEDSKTKKLKEVPKVSTIQDLRLKLELTNLDAKPLIIQKNYFAISRSIIAESPDLLKKGKFISDVRSFLLLHFNTIEDKSPPENKFIILESGKTFIKEIEISIDLDNSKPKMRDGNYYLGLVLQTWGGQSWAVDKVRKNWAKYGNLWEEPIVIQPISIKIQKPKEIEKCSE